MPTDRYAPWLALARQYFEHRAACARCVASGALACEDAQRLRTAARDRLRRIAAEYRAEIGDRQQEAAS